MASPLGVRISPETLSGTIDLVFPIPDYLFLTILVYTGFALQLNGSSFGCRTTHEVFQNI
jgi:hypothetical protein